jgi:hypothetical protein
MNPSIPVPFPLSLSLSIANEYPLELLNKINWLKPHGAPCTPWSTIADYPLVNVPREDPSCRFSAKLARCPGGTYHQPRMDLWNSLRRGAILMPSSKSFLFAPAAQVQLGKPIFPASQAHLNGTTEGADSIHPIWGGMRFPVKSTVWVGGPSPWPRLGGLP